MATGNGGEGMTTEQELERLRLGYERYETARRMNPQQWADAWKLNISTGKAFDEIIDDLRPFVRTKTEVAGKGEVRRKTDEEIQARIAMLQEYADNEVRNGLAGGEDWIRAVQGVIEQRWVLGE